MPFTFSHPALVIPVLRQRRRWPWLSVTGLVMGSIAPDFEKLFRLKLASGYSHTIASLFYFSCPVGLALVFVFHGLVRPAAQRHLPAPLHRRLAGLPAFEWPSFGGRRFWRLLASIWLGAASHLLWDSFTHYNAWLIHYLPWLGRTVMLPGDRVTTYIFLAQLSSLAGALIIARAVRQLPEQPVGPPPTATALRRYWGTAALVALALLSTWVLAARPSRSGMAVAAISAGLLGVLVASAWVQARQRWARGEARQAGA